MREKPEKLTLTQAFAGSLEILSRKAERIAQEIEEARETFPLLTSAVQFLLAYHGFLARKTMIAAASRRVGLPDVGFTPWPPEPDPTKPPLPEELCRFIPTTCRCFEGDIDACIDILGDEEEAAEPLKRVVPCDEICNAYQTALECALAFCDRRDDLSEAERREWVGCQQAIDENWARLLEHGCIQTQTFLESVRDLLPR